MRILTEICEVSARSSRLGSGPNLKCCLSDSNTEQERSDCTHESSLYVWVPALVRTVAALLFRIAAVRTVAALLRIAAVRTVAALLFRIAAVRTVAALLRIAAVRTVAALLRIAAVRNPRPYSRAIAN